MCVSKKDAETLETLETVTGSSKREVGRVGNLFCQSIVHSLFPNNSAQKKSHFFIKR